MQRELTLIKERKCEKETMATGYFIQGPSGELEAVQRWENEGGRLSQNHGHVLDSVRDDHLRHQKQATPTGRLAKRDASNNPKSITGWIPVGDGDRTLPQSVFAA